MGDFDELEAERYNITPKGVIALALMRGKGKDPLTLSEEIYTALFEMGKQFLRTNEVLDSEVAIKFDGKGGRFIAVQVIDKEP